MKYTKNGHVRDFRIDNGRVIATIKIGEAWVSNPTLADILADGWSEYVEPIVEPYLPTYAELVEQYIREHGYPTYGAEFAVINSGDAERMAAYQQVRAEAKEWAEQQPNREEESI